MNEGLELRLGNDLIIPSLKIPAIISSLACIYPGIKIAEENLHLSSPLSMMIGIGTGILGGFLYTKEYGSICGCVRLLFIQG